MSSPQHELPFTTEISDAASTHRHRRSSRSSGDAAVRAVSARPAPGETADNTHHHALTTKHADHASDTKRDINKRPSDSAADRELRAAEIRMKLKAAIEERKKMTPEERDATSWDEFNIYFSPPSSCTNQVYGGVPRSETSPQHVYDMLMETFGSI
ncbi:hypothetical protein FDECE_11152 [Fusarium decemcellulare]|nr:hypothetical protein FDECE_11152 [Fusarium decemcellulare]